MRLQLRERSRALATSSSQYLGDGNLRVVVKYALRHSAQEGERRYVPVAERLRGLPGICLYEYAVAVRQRHHEVVDPPLLAPYERPRLTEVALRVPRWVFQRHEHLTHHTPALPNVVLDYGVAAIEPVLLLQPIEDALRCVALLLRRAQVVFEYAVYDARVGLKLGAMGRALPAVSRELVSNVVEIASRWFSSSSGDGLLGAHRQLG